MRVFFSIIRGLPSKGKAAAVLVALLTAAGCATVPTEPLDPIDLVLPPGSRILTAEAEKDLLRFRLGPLSGKIEVPPALSTVSVQRVLTGADLGKLAAEALEEQPAASAIVLLARRTVEKRYAPYRVFRGWHTEPVIEGYENGQPVARKREVPQFETRYKNRCVRVRYRIFLYGRHASPLGWADPDPAAPKGCPENSDTDVVIDEFGAAARWLEERIRVAGDQ